MQHWYSFIYLYLVGGILFGLALFLGVKKGVLRLKLKHDRAVFFCILGAYVFYFLFQGIWNIWAISGGR
ncbi:MAG: hypothetical protein KAQ98_03580 [Bacteriovoracaceae bacterium]|nr:hypothetical protein [Bacteriovoracaceae bacterium]